MLATIKKRKAPADTTVSSDMSRVRKGAKGSSNDTIGGRPRARNFSRMLHQLIKIAAAHYRCCIATVCGFPNEAEVEEMAIVCWKKACRLKNTNVPISSEQIEVVRSYSSNKMLLT